MCNFKREAEDFIRREQLFAHLCICAFVWPMSPIKPPKKKKYTKDTIWWELFVNDHLFICVFVYSPTKSQPNHSLIQVPTSALYSTLRTLEYRRVVDSMISYQIYMSLRRTGCRYIITSVQEEAEKSFKTMVMRAPQLTPNPPIGNIVCIQPDHRRSILNLS